MYHLNKQQILIIRQLINVKEPISSDVLAVVLGTTAKTVRSNMNMINEILELTGGARIISKTGKGCYLEIFDKNEFRVFTQTFNTKYLDDYWIPTNSSPRISYIIRRLLFTEEYVKIDQFAEELYVSRVTITNDFREVKTLLSDYHLEVETRANYGIRLKGKESHIRVALSDYLNADEDGSSIENVEYKSLYKRDPQMITEKAAKKLIEYNVYISNNSLAKLVKLLIVSDYRIEHGFPIELKTEEKDEVSRKVEYQLAEAIIKDIGIRNWSETEVTFIAVFILSRRNITKKDFYDIRKERKYFEMSGRIIDWIFESIGDDLTVYPDMRQELARHLRGMFYRLKYGLEKKDVGILVSKGSNPAFEYAVVASRFLEESLGIKIKETEIAYLSYRFYTHFKSIFNHRKMNILVILANGNNAADLFVYELKTGFGKYIDKIDVIEFYQLKYTAIENFDCILTDIPAIRFDVKISVNRLNYFFSDNDIAELKDFFTMEQLNLKKFQDCFHEELFIRDIEAAAKEEVIKILVDKAKVHFNMVKDVADLVLNRERISSSEQGNCVAIPHTLFACNSEPVIAIGTLKKPIIWDKEKCRLVLLVFNGSNEYEPFSALSLAKTAVKNIQFVYDMINARSFKQAKVCISGFAEHYN